MSSPGPENPDTVPVALGADDALGANHAPTANDAPAAATGFLLSQPGAVRHVLDTRVVGSHGHCVVRGPRESTRWPYPVATNTDLAEQIAGPAPRAKNADGRPVTISPAGRRTQPVLAADRPPLAGPARRRRRRDVRP